MKANKKILLWPIIFALGFIPMIVHMKTYNSHLGQFDWFPSDSDTQTDFFLYYKMIAIITVAVIMLVILIYQCLTHSKVFKWHTSFYALGAYGLLAILSAVFSDYKYFVLHGSYELFESILVVIGYVILCFYTFQMVKTEEDTRYVLQFAAIGIGIITLIGFLQYLGLDFFRTNIGKRLITNPSYWPQVNELSFTFPLRTSYTTLYNTNYLSFYFGLLIPIVVLLFVFSKTIREKIFYAIASGIMLLTLIGSNSKSALLALGITAVLGAILLYRYLKRYWWVFAVIFAAIVIMMASYAHRIGGASVLFQLFFKGINVSSMDENPIKDVQTNDNDIVMKINDRELHIEYAADMESGYVQVFLSDENGNPLNYNYDDAALSYTLEDPEFENCSITPMYVADRIGLVVLVADQQWYFVKLEDDSYYYYNLYGKVTKIHKNEKSTFFRDGILSGRGMIWNNLIPKLKNKFLLGSGANTFMMEYPQDNYVYRSYANSFGLFDVKAHCFYFQQWLENGLLALLSVIAFYILYFVESFKIYIKIKNNNFSSAVGLGIYLGSFCYMICAITNDSNVNTAPVFWCLMGLGIAINQMVKKTPELFEKNITQ